MLVPNVMAMRKRSCQIELPLLKSCPATQKYSASVRRGATVVFVAFLVGSSVCEVVILLNFNQNELAGLR